MTAQVLKRHILRRFLDAGDDGLLILKLGAFRGDEAEHHLLAGRHAGQRREAAGALVVEFQEEGVDVFVCQQRVGHAVVAALAGPRAVEVAAADVCVDAQVCRCCVEHAVVDAQQLLLDACKPAPPISPYVSRSPRASGLWAACVVGAAVPFAPAPHLPSASDMESISRASSMTHLSILMKQQSCWAFHS